MAVTAPVTTAPAPGAFAVNDPTGAVFCGLIATVTGTASVPPLPSDTVTVKVSCLSAAVAPSADAACRASSVGV